MNPDVTDLEVKFINEGNNNKNEVVNLAMVSLRITTHDTGMRQEIEYEPGSPEAEAVSQEEGEQHQTWHN